GDFFRREVRRIDAEEIAAVVEFGGEGACRFDRRLIVAIEREHGSRDGWIFGDFANIGRRQWMFFEERIAEHFLQIGGESRGVVVGEGVELDLENLRDADEQMRRQRPLVVLDQIQIARRNVELCRKIGLRQPFAAPERADFGAQFVLCTHGFSASALQLYNHSHLYSAFFTAHYTLTY